VQTDRKTVYEIAKEIVGV